MMPEVRAHLSVTPSQMPSVKPTQWRGRDVVKLVALTGLALIIYALMRILLRPRRPPPSSSSVPQPRRGEEDSHEQSLRAALAKYKIDLSQDLSQTVEQLRAVGIWSDSDLVALWGQRAFPSFLSRLKEPHHSVLKPHLLEALKNQMVRAIEYLKKIPEAERRKIADLIQLESTLKGQTTEAQLEAYAQQFIAKEREIQLAILRGYLRQPNLKQAWQTLAASTQNHLLSTHLLTNPHADPFKISEDASVPR
jgi:hypothetical protein